MISKIEKGLSQPPISTYANIARELGISLSELVAEEDSHQNISVVKVKDREFVSNNIYDAYLLADHFSGKRFVPYLIHFPAEKKTFHKPFIHSKIQEMLYVLEGSIEFSYDGQLTTLDKGDCLCFKGGIPHASRTLGEKDAWILAIQISE